MTRLAVPTAALLVATAGVAMAAEEVKSGLAPGEKAPAYNSLDVTGPDKGKSLCLR